MSAISPLSEAPPDVRLPSLVGRHVRLKPISAGDYAFLQQVELGTQVGVRWRLRGSVPSPEQWAQGFWGSALASFLLVAQSAPETLGAHDAQAGAVGLVSLDRVDLADRNAHLHLMQLRHGRPEPVLATGLALFLDYVFSCWEFEKLYMDVPTYNADMLRSTIGPVFEIEGRLRQHRWFGGRMHDELVLCLQRDAWAERLEPLLELERAPLESSNGSVPSWPDVQALVAREAGVTVERVTPDATLVDDLGFDSFSLAGLLAALQAELGVVAQELGARQWRRVTAGTLVDRVRGRA